MEVYTQTPSERYELAMDAKLGVPSVPMLSLQLDHVGVADILLLPGPTVAGAFGAATVTCSIGRISIPMNGELEPE